jgi:phage recombination protein Bet
MTSPEQNIVIAKSLGYAVFQKEDNPYMFTLSLGNGFVLEIDVTKNPAHWKAVKDENEYQINADIVPPHGRRTAEAYEKAYQDAILDQMLGSEEPEEPKPEPKDLTEKAKQRKAAKEAIKQEEPEQKEEVTECKPELTLEEQMAILEALENGEIESPAPKTKAVQRRPEATKQVARYQTQAVSKPHNLIPATMRDTQISELTLEDIKNYICPTATDQEAFMFLKLCQARNLNPFLNEAYLIKYGDKATMTVGKEAFMRRAEAHPQFDGYEAGIIIQHEDKTLERREGTFILKGEVLVGGWARIYRKDRKQPFVSEVALHEYNTGKSLWLTKPATMIRKVSIVQGKREAFPSEFSGMYDQAEMGCDVVDVEYTVSPEQAGITC